MAENIGISEKLWIGLKNSYVRMAIALLGHPVKIITLDETDKDLGMTDLYQNVYLNPYHKLVKDLPEKEATAMITGVYGHEQMHQLLTDFAVFERERKKKPEDEQETFHMVCNIIEDPTIEYFANQYFGGKLLRALRFCIMQTYKQSPPLEESKTPAAQFFNALIQYGDGGILKGNFTFPEARRIFHEVIPFVDNAIETFDTEQRVRYMDKVFELSRPIWEPEKDFMKKLHELWKELGRDHGNSSGFGDPSIKGKLNKNAKPSVAQRRRKITFRRVSKEEAEELMKNSASGPIDPDADIEVLVTDEPLDGAEGAQGVPMDSATSGASGSETASDGSGFGSGGESETAGEEGEGKSTGDKGENEDEKTESSEGASGSGGSSSSDEAGGVSQGGNGYEGTEASISEDEYHLSDEMIEEIVKDIARALVEGEKELTAARDDEELNITPSSKVYNGVQCVNYKVAMDNPAAAAIVYGAMVSAAEGMIGNIVGQFKRIFRNDVAEKEYRNSGRVSMKRLSSGKVTSRVFEKRKAPGNKNDMAVMILVDESGSMRGLKSEVARLTAIILSEVFARLNIPIKVVGFTEGMSSKVEHYHYQSWRNSPTERHKLLNISARCSNFDGYSIRYASELLNKRQEEHKLLIVISDGYPAASYYESDEDGINDTRNAVQFASKQAKVLGILVGSVSPEKHQYMYGLNFIHIEKVTELPVLLAQRIKRIVKGW